MERKDNFVKSRKQTSHASRINFELQKQFGKQQKLRSGKIASYRSHFQKDNYETPSLDKCIEMLADDGRSFSPELIRCLDFHVRQNAVTTSSLLHIMKKLFMLLTTFKNMNVQTDEVAFIYSIVDFLLTLSSLGNQELVDHLVSCLPCLERFISQHSQVPQALLFNIISIMGNICVHNPCNRSALLQSNIVIPILSLSKTEFQPKIVSITCWFLSVFVDETMPLEVLLEMFVFISKALSSSDSEVVCDGLWLLCTANEISAHRQDVHVDPCFTLDAIKYLSFPNNNIAEPLLFVMGSTSKANYGLLDTEVVADFIGICLSVDTAGSYITKIAFSVANKLMFGLQCPIYITPDLIFRRLEELLGSESYSLHAEIVRFVDILLVLHHPAIHERTHYFCELIILHMSYIFSGVVDPEVLAILLEIIYHELMTHSNCNIKDLIINSPIGEALDNLAVVSENPEIRNLSGKLVELLFVEDENINEEPTYMSYVVNAQPRMGRGSAAVKPAWMT